VSSLAASCWLQAAGFVSVRQLNIRSLRNKGLTAKTRRRQDISRQGAKDAKTQRREENKRRPAFKWFPSLLSFAAFPAVAGQVREIFPCVFASWRLIQNIIQEQMSIAVSDQSLQPKNYSQLAANHSQPTSKPSACPHQA
jgi:hypothetical protein